VISRFLGVGKADHEKKKTRFSWAEKKKWNGGKTAKQREKNGDEGSVVGFKTKKGLYFVWAWGESRGVFQVKKRLARTGNRTKQTVHGWGGRFCSPSRKKRGNKH